MKHTLLLAVALAMASGAVWAAHESPFACNRLALTEQARKRHFDELGPALRDTKKTIREVPNGYEFEFPGDPATVQMVTEWVVEERLCCPFFDIELRFECEGGGVRLRLTGRDGVKTFIKSDFARWFLK